MIKTLIQANYYEELHKLHKSYVDYCIDAPEEDKGFDHFVEVCWAHGPADTVEDLVCEIYLYRKRFGQLKSDV